MRKIIIKITLFLLVTPYSIFSSFSTESMIDLKMNQLNQPWTSYSKNPSLNIHRLIKILESTSSGKNLVKQAIIKAKSQGNRLSEVIKIGDGSLTDTTLYRKFHQDNIFHVTYESKSEVYLNIELTGLQALLDLAHELSHFVYRETLNPYDLNFTMVEFIKSTIEGKGGEAQAYIYECKVLHELFGEKAVEDHSCHRVVDLKTKEFSMQKVVKEFYYLGQYSDEFQKLLKDNGVNRSDVFPNVNTHEVLFYSSAYSLPYPLAAIAEYQNVISKACNNDHKRLNYLKNNPTSSDGSRLPASEDLSKIHGLVDSFNKRCGIKISYDDQQHPDK